MGSLCAQDSDATRRLVREPPCKSVECATRTCSDRHCAVDHSRLGVVRIEFNHQGPSTKSISRVYETGKAIDLLARWNGPRADHCGVEICPRIDEVSGSNRAPANGEQQCLNLPTKKSTDVTSALSYESEALAEIRRVIEIPSVTRPENLFAYAS